MTEIEEGIHQDITIYNTITHTPGNNLVSNKGYASCLINTSPQQEKEKPLEYTNENPTACPSWLHASNSNGMGIFENCCRLHTRK